jgi:hypothetical protein
VTHRSVSCWIIAQKAKMMSMNCDFVHARKSFHPSERKSSRKSARSASDTSADAVNAPALLLENLLSD